MTYRTDRSRVEDALAARLLRRCLAGIIAGYVDSRRPADPDHVALLEDLRLCCEEPLAGLEPRKAEKLRARLDRAANQALEPYEKDALIKVSIMVMYWMVERTETGDLALSPGSRLEECFNRLQAGLAAHADLWNDVNRSAAKQAVKLHDRLLSLGYFRRDAGAVAA